MTKLTLVARACVRIHGRRVGLQAAIEGHPSAATEDIHQCKSSNPSAKDTHSPSVLLFNGSYQAAPSNAPTRGMTTFSSFACLLVMYAEFVLRKNSASRVLWSSLPLTPEYPPHSESQQSEPRTQFLILSRCP